MSNEKHRMSGKAVGIAIVTLGVVASILAILTFFGKGTLADFLGARQTPIVSNSTSCSVESAPTDIAVTVHDSTSLAQGSSSADSEFVSSVSAALGARGDLDRYASFINVYAGTGDANDFQLALQVANGASQALESGNLTLSKAVFKTFFALDQPSNQIRLEIYFYPRGCTPGS